MTVLSGAVTELKKTTKLVVLTVSTTAHVEKISNKRLWFIDLGTTRVWVRAPGKVQYVLSLDGITTDWFDYRADEGTLILTVPEPRIDDQIVEIDPARIDVIKQIGWARLDANSCRFVEQAARQKIIGQLIAAGASEVLRERARRDAEIGIRRVLAPAMRAMQRDVSLEIRFKPE